MDVTAPSRAPALSPEENRPPIAPGARPLDPSSDLSHARVVSDAGSARGYWLLIPSLLSMRYLVEFAKYMLGDYAPGWMKPRADRRMKPIEEYVEGKVGPEGRDAALKQYVRVMDGWSNEPKGEKLDEMRASCETTQADGLRAKAGALSQEGLVEHGQRLTRNHDFLKKAAEQIDGHHLAHFYDTSLGLGSVAVTAFYARQVWGNIRSLFTETVAYDLGKKPEDVTASDILRSDNKIVHDAVRNYGAKNFERLFTDSIFFARHLSHLPGLGRLEALNFGMLGIGVKGGLVFRENKRHQQPTMFEDLVKLVTEKIDLHQGVGHPITGADIASLYQKYALIHDPKQAAGAGAVGDPGINWAQSEPIFADIAERMNRTYRHRYFQSGAVSGADAPTSDFALPKLLFLLGHGLIDPMNPARTGACVEIADTQGIAALQQEIAHSRATPKNRVEAVAGDGRVAGRELRIA